MLIIKTLSRKITGIYFVNFSKIRTVSGTYLEFSLYFWENISMGCGVDLTE
jgi:hypothetical protein